MSLAVHKYLLRNVDGVSHVTMPKDARILHCEAQCGEFMLWAIVDLETKSSETRHFLVLGTGQKFDATDLARMKHINTFQQDIFVWHVFEWA
jgi:hypothetical protein